MRTANNRTKGSELKCWLTWCIVSSYLSLHIYTYMYIQRLCVCVRARMYVSYGNYTLKHLRGSREKLWILCAMKNYISLSAAVTQMQNRNTLIQLMSLWPSTALSQVILTGLSIRCVYRSQQALTFFLKSMLSIRRAICRAHMMFLCCWVSPLSQSYCTAWTCKYIHVHVCSHDAGWHWLWIKICGYVWHMRAYHFHSFWLLAQLKTP